MAKERTKQPINVKKKLDTLEETADKLGGVHPRTVARIAKRGKIESCYVGSRHMIVAESTDRYIAAGGK